MSPRNRFLAALERRPLAGRVPHFELVFYLTMEAFGKLHPEQRHYAQWGQMEEKERQLHRQEMADLYLAVAKRFEHSAILLRPNPNTEEETFRLIDLIRDKSGDRYFLMLHGDATFAISDGNHMADFVAPYLADLIRGCRDLGFCVIKHTDGNIMPILDQLVEAGPHALHSLDPQAGVDIAEVKRLCGDRVCLIGNVNCGLLDTGTDEEMIESARYALRHGMPGGGYVFSTSNCIYTGMRLSRYQLMLDVWRREETG